MQMSKWKLLNAVLDLAPKKNQTKTKQKTNKQTKKKHSEEYKQELHWSSGSWDSPMDFEKVLLNFNFCTI